MANKKIKIPFSFERLQYVMDCKKVNRTSLCGAVGCSEHNFKQWKRTGEITERDLTEIAVFLNIDFDWLTGYEYLRKTKTAPITGDYVRDPEGYIIPRYRKETIYGIGKHLSDCNQLFLNWIREEPLFDFVNKELISNNQAPVQRKEFDHYMSILEPTLDGDAFTALVNIISEYITLVRQRREDQ